MFVVTDAYTLKTGLDQATNQLDRFHLEMLNYAVNEIFLKIGQPKRLADAEAFSDFFQQIIPARYAEYRPLLADDLADQYRMKLWTRILCAFADHLFVEPLTEMDKSETMLAAGIQFLATLNACLESLTVEAS